METGDGMKQSSLIKWLLFLTIGFMVFASGGFAFAKTFEITQEDIEKIEEILGDIEKLLDTIVPDSVLKKALNSVLKPGETSSDATYGLLVFAGTNELEFIDMVTSQAYKSKATQYFNRILDDRLNMGNYYKGIVKDLPKILSGKITNPVGALTLNTFDISNNAFQAFVALQNLKIMQLYDAFWIYFDFRRGNETHGVAWEYAKTKLGVSTVNTGRFFNTSKSNNPISLESQFSQLWDKWGPYTTSSGVTDEGKQEFKKAMQQLIKEAVANPDLQKQNDETSFLGGIGEVFGRMADAAWSAKNKAQAGISSVFSRVNKKQAGAGISLVNDNVDLVIAKKDEGEGQADDPVAPELKNEEEIEDAAPAAAEVESSADVVEQENQEETPVDQKTAETQTVTQEEISIQEAPVLSCDIPVSLLPQQDSIIFQEIAWMGTVNSANDEWFRIKNISNSSISLKNWQILDKNKDINIVLEESSVIFPNNTMLFERTDDTSLPEATASLIYTGALSNTDESLYIFNENCVLKDSVVANPAWPGGDADLRKPMERNGLSWVQNAPNLNLYVSSGGGSSSSPEPSVPEAPKTYSKIIITEIQIEGVDSQTEEFVELYNPGESEVDLTGWYVQKKTQSASSFSTFASSTLSSDAKIPAKGYFLIARENSSFVSQSNITTSYSLAENNTLALKNPNGEIADKVGWGEAQDFEGSPAMNPSAGFSLGRIYGSAYTDTDDNSQDFELQIPTPKEINQKYVSIEPLQDEEQEDEDTQEVLVQEAAVEKDPVIELVDTVAPEVSFAPLASKQASVFFEVGWIASDAGEISSGLDAVYLEYSVSPSQDGIFLSYFQGDQWQDWAQENQGTIEFSPITSAVSVTAQDGVTYLFSLFAKDEAGNESAPVYASTFVDFGKSVVINEIAWMGTKASSSDEWIELLNTTSEQIDLAGWKLQSSDGSGPSLSLSGKINAQGLYLIERTDDKPTTESANLKASFGNGLLNTNCEVLYLYDSEGNIADQTACKKNGDWPAGTTSPYYISMERIDAKKGGTDIENWAGNNLIKHNGRDEDGIFINGTPKQSNSVSAQSTVLEFRFNEFSSMILPILGSPYHTSSYLIIPEGKTLAIEPGVVIRFEQNHSKLIVEGTLKAVGTPEKQITFRDSFNGVAWCGMEFSSTSKDSVMEYITFKGGSGCNNGPGRTIMVDGSDITIKHATLTSGDSRARIVLKNSDSIIDSSLISGATNKPYEGAGIFIQGGNPTITNSVFSDNYIGIHNKGPSGYPVIENNTFTNNTFPIELHASSADLSGNTASANTHNGIYVTGGATVDLVWENDGLPYIMNLFTVFEGKTLTLGPGVVVKFHDVVYADSGLTVHGTFIAQGTKENKVVFTSNSDDSFGGNSFEGIGSIPKWRRIYFSPKSTGSILENVILRYGGKKASEGTIHVDHSNLVLQNVEIEESLNSAIRSFVSDISGSNLILKNNKYAFYVTSICPLISQVFLQEGGDMLHPSSLKCSF